MTAIAEAALVCLRKHDVTLSKGLRDDQLDSIESEFTFTFAVDHRALLSLAVPTGDNWFDWRKVSKDEITDSLRWPFEGIVWDVHNNDFWPRPWGARPDSAVDREDTALAFLSSVPPLVPIFGHRFMPAVGDVSGAPVFSVHQADVIYYGSDLEAYFERELAEKPPMSPEKLEHIRRMIEAIDAGQIPPLYESDEDDQVGPPEIKIPFWSNLAEGDPDYGVWRPGEGRAFKNG